jgi:hypothetical protein
VLPILCITILSRLPTFSNLQVWTVFLQKCGLLHKVNCQGHLNGSEQYQITVGCGLMDHNNYLIGSVGFMSWNSWPNMSTTCIETMHLTLRYSYPYPTHKSFCCNQIKNYLHLESCNCLLVTSDTKLVFKRWCDCIGLDSNGLYITDVAYVRFYKHRLGCWLGRCN